MQPERLEIGSRYGRLVVKEETRQSDRVAYVCACDCGREFVSRATAIRLGRTTSCGCYRRERAAERRRVAGQAIVPGERHGRLVAVQEVERGKYGRRILCQCDCGGTRVVFSNHFFRGKSTSCGCKLTETLLRRNSESARHRLTNSPTWVSWQSMITRCTNSNTAGWKHYGGRGIRVCDRWRGREGFERFLVDVGVRPTGKTLDRIDVNGHYEPGNVRWASAKQQARNQRTTVLDDVAVSQIRWLVREGGHSQTSVARAWGISQSHVSLVVREKLWGPDELDLAA